MIGSLAAVTLPEEQEAAAKDQSTAVSPSHPWHVALRQRFQIEVPVSHWPWAPKRLVRISAQAYNEERQYVVLADALRTLLADEGAPRVG